ncbi:hypothetical protein GPALN_007815 [Globodera pallida]|nr:hypothetical protein GPALN_007815 [Globodera pallida]
MYLFTARPPPAAETIEQQQQQLQLNNAMLPDQSESVEEENSTVKAGTKKQQTCAFYPGPSHQTGAVFQNFFFFCVPGIVLALWHCFSDMFNGCKKESFGVYNKSAGIGRTMDGQKE